MNLLKNMNTMGSLDSDVLCVIYDDNEYLTSFINTYPKVLDLKVEHLGNHASFLDLGIKIVCFRI